MNLPLPATDSFGAVRQTLRFATDKPPITSVVFSFSATGAPASLVSLVSRGVTKLIVGWGNLVTELTRLAVVTGNLINEIGWFLTRWRVPAGSLVTARVTKLVGLVSGQRRVTEAAGMTIRRGRCGLSSRRGPSAACRGAPGAGGGTPRGWRGCRRGRARF